jgi:hypothetical protein
MSGIEIMSNWGFKKFFEISFFIKWQQFTLGGLMPEELKLFAAYVQVFIISCSAITIV